tara:strand:- start:26 stop:430 length:405 start_codon:yes stop_codon:yes gene_type:complete
MSSQTRKNVSKFKNEQVGTDKDLENKVSNLENIYIERNAIEFIMSDNPVDLTRVISADGSSKKRRKNIWVSGIINRANDSPMALINVKDKTYNIVKGDSIAGGVILDITATEVTFEKNNKISVFDLGVKSNNVE